MSINTNWSGFGPEITGALGRENNGYFNQVLALKKQTPTEWHASTADIVVGPDTDWRDLTQAVLNSGASQWES